MLWPELIKEVNNEIYYAGDDLGVTCRGGKTKFKIWSPPAEKVEVILYAEEDSKHYKEIFPLHHSESGCWEVTVPVDLCGSYYLFRLKFPGDICHITVDPYARAVSTNSRRGLIVNLAQTDPHGWEEDKRIKLKSPVDAVIYELHVRDFSVSPYSGIEHKGKYIAFLEKTKNYDGHYTGIKHLQELGVTHVHLLPVFDFATVDDLGEDYNWGYDPYFYNVPEGSYSINPGDFSRIMEFKLMVKALHDAGIGVIMDVVYNHTYYTKKSPFQLMVPGYYYRRAEKCQPANGSGCGNEMATEKPMMRKFIIDSVKYWAEEYHIDGFRFDLMGLIDKETMAEVERELHKIDESIIIYGEPWYALPPQLHPERRMFKGRQRGMNIAVFNDHFRDSIRGDNNGYRKGFVSGAPFCVEGIKRGVVGGVDYNHKIKDFALNPTESVNYVSAHDNLTLWDKLSRSNPDDSEEIRKKMDRMAQAIVFTSQGIPFLQGGEEFLRTKYGNYNSYNAGDEVNQLKWERKNKYFDVFKYYQGLIKLRREHPAFRMRNISQVKEHLKFLPGPANTVGFIIKNNANGDDWQDIMVFYNPCRTWHRFEIEKKEWNIVVDDKNAGVKPFITFTAGNVKVPPLSVMVLYSA